MPGDRANKQLARTKCGFATVPSPLFLDLLSSIYLLSPALSLKHCAVATICSPAFCAVGHEWVKLNLVSFSWTFSQQKCREGVAAWGPKIACPCLLSVAQGEMYTLQYRHRTRTCECWDRTHSISFLSNLRFDPAESAWLRGVRKNLELLRTPMEVEGNAHNCDKYLVSRLYQK